MGNPQLPQSPSRRPPARLVRELAPFVVLACACGAAVRQQPPAPARGPEPVVSATPAADASADEAKAAFVALAARGGALAPGMREVARKECGTEAVDLVKAEGRDVCVRVAYEATVPVTAKLVDGAGRVLATGGAATAEGVLAEHGPVCVRRGDVVRGVAEGAGARVRWMAWEAP